MFRKPLAAFAAATAAFVVGAAAASAAVTNQPLSAVETDRSVTFSYEIPAGTEQSAVLVDFNSDGVSDFAISGIGAQGGSDPEGGSDSEGGSDPAGPLAMGGRTSSSD